MRFAVQLQDRNFSQILGPSASEVPPAAEKSDLTNGLQPAICASSKLFCYGDHFVFTSCICRLPVCCLLRRTPSLPSRRDCDQYGPARRRFRQK